MPNKREMEGRVELAQEQDFSLIMAIAVAHYTTLYEFLNIPQTSKGCSKYLRRQTFQRKHFPENHISFISFSVSETLRIQQLGH